MIKNGALEVVEAFGKGECNVYASGVVERTPTAIRKFYTGAYVVGTAPLTRESFALVTREDDPVFSKFVDIVVNAILYADAQGITQKNYLRMPRINLLQSLINNDSMLRNVIRAVGSFREIWERHATPQGLERSGRNELVTFPLGPMLTQVYTWDKPPPNQ